MTQTDFIGPSDGFSPFSRKVAMALEYKGLAFETVDALSHANRERLLAVNPRAEVPVLVDGEITVVNSSDNVDYLDRRYPELARRPDRVAARTRLPRLVLRRDQGWPRALAGLVNRPAVASLMPLEKGCRKF